MNRQTRTFIVIAVAVIAASAASYGVYQAIARLPQRPAGIATTKAVVAASSMPLGTLLTRDSVKVVDWPATTPLQGGFTKIDDVVDRGLIAAVGENEPLSENKLAPKEAGAGLPPTITPGMRAISVKVNEVIGVAGFVVPGTHVDVVVIISELNQKDDKISRVVVSNVQVLTAGTRYDEEESRKDGKAIRSSVVTLMVSPLDAERIALAQSEGDLMLTLRHPLDVEPGQDRGVRRVALFATDGQAEAPVPAVKRRTAAPAPAAPPPPPPPSVARPYTVETIRAAKRSEEKLLDAVALP